MSQRSPVDDFIPSRYLPPTRKSTSAIVVEHPSGRHHFLSDSGSVQARKTLSLGAEKTPRSRTVVFRPVAELFIQISPLHCSDTQQARHLAPPRNAGSGLSTGLPLPSGEGQGDSGELGPVFRL